MNSRVFFPITLAVVLAYTVAVAAAAAVAPEPGALRLPSNQTRLALQAAARAEFEGSVTCSSRSFKPALCDVPGVITSLVVTNQRSNSACTAGSSFFAYPGAALVIDGCRATFKYTGFDSSFPFTTVLCESSGTGTKTCDAPDGTTFVRLFKDLSSGDCTDGTYSVVGGNSIQVTSGCSGVFGAFTV